MTTGVFPDYLGLLISGQAEKLDAFLNDNPVVDDPSGRCEGRGAVLDFLERKSADLRSGEARAERMRLTATPQRAVDEQVLHLNQDGQEIRLPYAVVMEAEPDEKLSAIRVYHSHWPLIHKHLVRQAILEEDAMINLPGVVARYQRALADGSVEDVLAVFEAEGYAREPAGSDYVHQGHAALRQFYSSLFSLGQGGIPLQHCTATFDGVACALEYNVVSVGSMRITPQAGVAVYELGPSGKLRAARIYDDVDIPE